MSEDSAATKLVQRSDGTETLVLRQARLVVRRGPDKGQELIIDQPKVIVGTGEDCDLRLTDEAVSRHHLEILATDEGYQVRDLGSTNGTIVGALQLAQVTAHGPVILEIGETRLQLLPTTDTVEIPLSPRGQFGGLLGRSRRMRQVFAILERVAPSTATILLQGESGTGKEVAAQAIHQASDRREGEFVVIDCGAIPATLIESELFGYEKGAFTGADATRTGRLEQADGGTVFLDEVGELPKELQPRLLRFLERQEVKPIGSARHRRVDVRIIAATNRRLAAEVESGRIRQDLYYRLSVVRVELPPLRDRPEDVSLLAHHFAASLQHDPATVITDEVASVLTTYHWPGNVRELRNFVERMTLLPELAVDSIQSKTPSNTVPVIGALSGLPFHEARRRWRDIFERQYLSSQVARSGGVVKQAASNAGLPRQTFHRLMRKHGLKDD